MISRRIFAAVAVLCLMTSPALSQKTKAQLNTEINATFIDNTVGAITPSGLRAVTSDLANSIMPTAPVVSGNLACFDGTTGLLIDCGSAPTTIPLTIGTTPLNNSVPSRVIADIGGKLGEYAISGSGSVCMTASCTLTTPTLVTADIGTPSAGTLTNTTGLPVSTGITGFGTGVANALAVNTNTSGGFPTVGNVVTSITPGGGQVSSITANCSQSAIGTTGTISSSRCVNAQVGTSYAIVDGDRGKIITASNAAAQAYSIAQASTASAFFSGWYTDIENNSTNVAGIVTITPTTSQICAQGTCAATYKIQPGQFARITSDGTNYQVTFNPSTAQLPATITNDAANAGNLGEYQTTTLVLGSAISLSTGVTSNIITQSLTAGDWDVRCGILFRPAATTNYTFLNAGITLTSATLPTTDGLTATQIANTSGVVLGNVSTSAPVVMNRFSLSTTTNVFCVAQSTFTISTMQAYAAFQARRMR